jgi:MYXO-CTERM domain-containing protein
MRSRLMRIAADGLVDDGGSLQMRSSLASVCGYGVSVVGVLLAMPGYALAGNLASAPEIDGASISAGLGLLAAGILILRSRRRTK